MPRACRNRARTLIADYRGRCSAAFSTVEFQSPAASARLFCQFPRRRPLIPQLFRIRRADDGGQNRARSNQSGRARKGDSSRVSMSESSRGGRRRESVCPSRRIVEQSEQDEALDWRDWRESRGPGTKQVHRTAPRASSRHVDFRGNITALRAKCGANLTRITSRPPQSPSAGP